MTQATVEEAGQVPQLNIENNTLERINEFTYLGFTISANLSLHKGINRCIGTAAVTKAKLFKGVWEDRYFTMNIKFLVYGASVLSTLLYGSKSWPTHIRQERHLNTFDMHFPKHTLGII